MIVFNLFALGQVIIIIACIALLHWILNLIGFDLDLIGGTQELPFSLIMGAYIAAFTDLRGLKGRLFWLPVWSLLIVASLLICRSNLASGYFNPINGENGQPTITDYYPLIYIAAGLIVFYFYKNLNRFMMKRWEVSKTALVELKQLEFNDTNKKEFWNLLSIAYFKPSPLFYHSYGTWSRMYKNTINELEYITHTIDILHLLNGIETGQKRHQKWISTFYETVKGVKTLNEFNPPFMGFKRLETFINQNTQ